MKNKYSRRSNDQAEQLNLFDSFENFEDDSEVNNYQDSLSEVEIEEQKQQTIADYIDEKCEKIGDLIRKYHPPISTFIPTARKVETEEIYTDDDIRSLSDKFSDFIFPISTQDIKKWLSQFETFKDKNIAYILLKKMQFLSRNKVIEGCRTLRYHLMNFLKNHPALKEAFYTHNPSLRHNDSAFESWLENHCIHYSNLPSGKGNTSQTRMQKTYEVLWDIYKSKAVQHCHQTRRFEPIEFHFSNSKKDADKTVFVFMDFTNASGDTLVDKNAKAIRKTLKEFSKWENSWFVFLYIVESRKFQKEKLQALLPNSTTLFAEEMLSYDEPSVIAFLENHEISQEEYEAFIDKYCSLFGEKGYKDQGFLTVHYYSCPNNTLPFFYKEIPGKWIRLFQPSQIPRAGRYS